MNLRSTVLLAALLSTLFPAAAQSRRPQVELACEAHGMGPLLDCTVRLRTADGKPLTGAAVTLGATMPSMPMAHTVKPVKAQPTATPGEYRGQLTLEMSGAWAIEIDLSGPVRDRVVRVLQAEECEGDGRCPARPARR